MTPSGPAAPGLRVTVVARGRGAAPVAPAGRAGGGRGEGVRRADGAAGAPSGEPTPP
ncbi:hypothetical protein [Streptomyces sp. CC224B]|uniref:hypothetical protein n=1 Tax=Streptomyces sp. CC224B TaxID=3044571 RepID=UPI0024A994D2|nr:hypothetical protein [Streptomyces sp. CC224B]